jgi:large subunit ribosomal protein L5
MLDQDARLQKQLKVKNTHQIPRIVRVVVNVGVGKQRDNAPFIRAVIQDIMAITGQMPHARRARQAVSGFNVRQGDLVGYRATLRGRRMRDFVQRFVHVTLPRMRDFRGLSLASLDGQGNLSVGLPEQLPFPEIRPEKTDFVFGVQVTFVTTASDIHDAEALFRVYGFPFKKK